VLLCVCAFSLGGVLRQPYRDTSKSRDCNTLPHTATNYHTLQHTTHTARHHTLQHTAATHPRPGIRARAVTATHCHTLQHTATHCNTLPHAATHHTLQHTAATHPRPGTRARAVTIKCPTTGHPTPSRPFLAAHSLLMVSLVRDPILIPACGIYCAPILARRKSSA